MRESRAQKNITIKELQSGLIEPNRLFCKRRENDEVTGFSRTSNHTRLKHVKISKILDSEKYKVVIYTDESKNGEWVIKAEIDEPLEFIDDMYDPNVSYKIYYK